MEIQPPVATCLTCGRRCPCAVMSDGTIYRPFAWTFTDSSALSGLCGGCAEALTCLSCGAVDPPRPHLCQEAALGDIRLAARLVTGQASTEDEDLARRRAGELD
jgi:hypothetical protein